MLTQWVSQTWREFHKKNSDVIRQTFKKLELSLTIDESEDHELFIKNILDVTVEDWRLAKDQHEEIIDDLIDSKEMNEMNELKMIENDEIKKSNEETKYVRKNELSEHEKDDEDERNSDNELKN